MQIGYTRITAGDTAAEHRLRMWQEVADIAQLYVDRLQGKDNARPELMRLLANVQQGDTVYTPAFARLAISTKDLLYILHELQQRGVRLVAVREQFDTSTREGQTFLAHLQVLGEFEQAVMEERQSAGIEVAKAQGRYRGRVLKDRPANWLDLVARLRSREIPSIAALARHCHCSRPTIYRWLKEDKETLSS